jgi:hypothetical protein
MHLLAFYTLVEGHHGERAQLSIGSIEAVDAFR